MLYQIPKYCVRKFWVVVLFLNTIESISGATVNGPAIDKFHGKLFPECGHLPKIATSRIINSKKANVHYPWVVMVLRYYKGMNVGLCGGSIITKRSVLSCAHCVCGKSPNNPKRPGCLSDSDSKISESLNQITKDNKVQIASGDNRDKKYISVLFLKVVQMYTNEVDEIRIKFYESNTKEDEKKRPVGYFYDIAVLRSTKDIFVSGDPKRAPICLGASNAIIDNDQVITTVGWGTMYEEYPERDFSNPNQIRNPRRTTCTTNRNGPLLHRFKKCDIHFLRDNNWSCKKVPFIKYRRPRNSELPMMRSDPLYEFDACKKYFSYTEKVISNKIGNTIKWSKHLGTLDNLHVKGHKGKARNALPEGHIECFRKELFESNGWCKVESPFNHKGEDAWGFCDTSCDGVKTYWKDGAKTPNVYHEMTWSMKNRRSHKPKVCGVDKKYCKLPYMVCEQGIFPKTPTMFIEYKDEQTEKRLDTKIRIVKVDPLPILERCTPENIGTQMTSFGDSGTGHWIINTESKPSRAVLVAMTTQGKRAKSSQSQITTDKTILSFIKKTLIQLEPSLVKKS